MDLTTASVEERAPGETSPGAPGDLRTGISEIWLSILDVDSVGTGDDFFDIGGNSMMLLVMLEKIQETYSVEIELEDLTDGITIDILAELISR